MKIGNVAGRPVLIDVGSSTTGEVADLRAADFSATTSGKFATFADIYADIEGARAAVAAAQPVFEAIEATSLQAPVPDPGQVFGVGANYHDHLAEAGASAPPLPLVFTKFPSSVTGPFAQVEIPTTTVDFEVELVLVMGKYADRVSSEDAWNYVAGVMVGQDFSARGVQRANQMSLGKSFRGFAPIGPWVTTLDEVADPDALPIRCEVSGEELQNGTTADMVFSSAQVVSLLSCVTALRPGDLVFTGTCAGVGLFRNPPRYLRPGDTVYSQIDGLGFMRNECIAPTSRGEYDDVLQALGHSN